ncbi:MAG: PadR family transcriptional regulator [Actinobacteria bacterium]|nr:PadR family transcriptional regulator [Actinomycetota bacterium]
MSPALLILLSLLEGPRHGYAIAADIEAFAGKRLGPGTLYGAIGRLVDAGFVIELPEVERRKPFQITELGRRHVQVETRSMAAIVRTAKARRVERPVADQT